MDSRRCKCQWCGMKMAAPVGAQTIICPRCQSVTQLHPPRNYGFANFPPASNNMSPGFPARPGRLSPIQPQQFNMPPRINNMRPPAVHGRKRAVLCGITYRGHPKSLKGSINDVLSMRYFLVEKLGFPNASVIVLTGMYRYLFTLYLNIDSIFLTCNTHNLQRMRKIHTDTQPRPISDQPYAGLFKVVSQEIH